MNLLSKCYNRFSSFHKFWSAERNTENTMSDLHFNEESDYSEENTSDNETFEPEQKKKWGNESHEKETKHIDASPADSLHIRIGNFVQMLQENEAGEIDCFCCREVDAILIVSAKIPKHEGSILPSSFYG